MAQLVYNQYHAAGFEGQLALPNEAVVIRPGINASGASIPVGRFVVNDLANNSSVDASMKLPSGTDTAATVMGILMMSNAYPTTLDGATSELGKVADGFIGNVVRQGTVWMKCEQAVNQGDTVFMRITADANPVGSVRKDADSGEAVTLAGIAKFASAAGAGEMVMVSILLP
jgi:hypothetical protein